jgi:hypothetical protein
VKVFEWILEFSDKNAKTLFSFRANEQNNFDAGFSVLWFSLTSLDVNVLNDITHLKVYARLLMQFDLKTGKFSFSNQTNQRNSLHIKWKKHLISENKFNFDMKQSHFKLTHSENKLIRISQVYDEFLFAFWNSNTEVTSSKFLNASIDN